MKLLVIDTETGGLDANKHSILSAAGVYLDTDTFETKKVFDFYVREPSFVLQDAAMKVNNIDMNEVIKTGLSPNDAVLRIINSTQNFFGCAGVSERITLAGHNVGFDITFLKRLFSLSNSITSFERVFSHRTIDTVSILQFLQLTCQVPSGSANLDSLLVAAGVEKEENVRHTAIGDAILTAEALKRLIKKFKVIQ